MGRQRQAGWAQDLCCTVDAQKDGGRKDGCCGPFLEPSEESPSGRSDLCSVAQEDRPNLEDGRQPKPIQLHGKMGVFTVRVALAGPGCLLASVICRPASQCALPPPMFLPYFATIYVASLFAQYFYFFLGLTCSLRMFYNIF